MSHGLLQLTAVRHQWRATSPPAVGTECRRTVGHRRLTTSHQCYGNCTGFQTSSPSASHVQGPAAGAPVISCSCASVPCWWLSAAVGCRQIHPSVEFHDFRILVVPRTHNKFGDRISFSAAGPRLWNDLPPGLRRPDLSFPMFRQKLKTLLFDWSA